MQITFTIENVHTYVQAPAEYCDALDKEFSYFVDGYQFTKAFKKGWDGKRHLFSGKKFPTGLLEDAEDLATSKGYEVDIIDKRELPPLNLKPLFLRGAEDRDNQLEAIEAAVERERGIIWAATGSGKTNMMAGIIQVLNLPTILMVHSAGIAQQTRRRFIDLLGRRDIGIYTGEQKTDGKIVCATFQSLMSQFEKDRFVLHKWLNQFQVLCIDEGHHSLAYTFQAMINECPAYFRFGFSATPEKGASFTEKSGQKGARLHIVGSTGPPLHIYTAGQGTQDGYLVGAKIRMRKWHPDTPTTRWKADEFEINDRLHPWSGRVNETVTINGKKVTKKLPFPVPGLYEVGITKHAKRNIAVAEAVCELYNAGGNVLCIVSWIDQAKILLAEIEKRVGFKPQFISGPDKKNTRATKQTKFKEGENRILIATGVFDEGIDIPEIDSLVMAGGGKAQYKVIQRLGRGMRPHGGKEYLDVIDFMDTHSRVLWKHSKERLDAYKSDPIAYEVIIEDVS